MLPSAQTLPISQVTLSSRYDSRLLADIEDTRRKKFDEEGDGVVGNDDLGV